MRCSPATVLRPPVPSWGDRVKARLDSDEGCSFTELAYQTLQAYDFLHLHRHHNCRIQLGGSDQWGNIVAGIDLIRKVEAAPAWGTTMPLLTTSAGEKLGKSAGNAVWLDSGLTSSYHFYQYFLNLADDEAATLLVRLAPPGMSHEEVDDLQQAHQNEPGSRIAQRELATWMTEWVRGAQGLQQARHASEILFGGRPFDGFTASEVAVLFHDMPVSEMAAEQLVGRLALEVSVQCGACKSNAEAKRLIKNGGLYINNRRVEDIGDVVPASALIDEKLCVIRTGKKKNFVVCVS